MPRLAPSVEAVHAGRVRAVARRNVGPRRPGAEPPEDAVEHAAIIDASHATHSPSGSRGSIADHSKSVKSNRAIDASSKARNESAEP